MSIGSTRCVKGYDGPVDELATVFIEIGKVPWQVTRAVRYHVHPHDLSIMQLPELRRPEGRWNRWRWKSRYKDRLPDF